jgi:RIO kinase 1
MAYLERKDFLIEFSFLVQQTLYKLSINLQFMAKPREKFKTEHGVFDNFANKTLFKLSSEGHFDGLQSPISIGKESNVFAAITKQNKLVAVKIYRLETCDFNRLYDYIKFDPRFAGVLKRRRYVIFAWAKREYRNLLLAREAGVSCPTPLAFKNNILVEEFIGDDSAAPRLIHAPPKDTKKFFTLLLNNIKKLYKSGLTHGDLSQFNILNYNEKPILIDFSQTTTKKNPTFQELFERDVTIICTYFNKLGLKLNIKTIIKQITQ